MKDYFLKNKQNHRNNLDNDKTIKTVLNLEVNKAKFCCGVSNPELFLFFLNKCVSPSLMSYVYVCF